MGDETWSNYTITLKARKVGARGEGFLIAFGKKGGDKYWWNVGGFGNSQHDVELNQTLLGRAVRASLEADRWYDVKVVLKDRHIQCFLDGRQIHDITVPAQDRFFANAGRDEASGEMVIKAINVSPNPVSGAIHVAGLSNFASQGDVTVISSARLTDNNTMSNPKKVIPVTGQINISGGSFNCDFPANSFTLIRLKAR
jgi:alpha-L-arabinofuranosidase